MDQDPSLGVLRGENVSIDGHSPSLVHAHLRITGHSINDGFQFGAEEENVHATEGGDVVQGLYHRSFEDASIEIAYQTSVNVDYCTSLTSKTVRLDEDDEKT